MRLAALAMVGLMVTSVSQTAHNYITLPKIRSRGPQSRLANRGAVVVICGLLAVYGVSKANASTDIDCPSVKHMVISSLGDYENLVVKLALGEISKERKARLKSVQKEVLITANTYSNVYTAFCK